jgi:hypothetical protein
MTWHGICAICGQPVTGAGKEPDLPAGQQKVVHLECLALEKEKSDGDVAEDSEIRG